MKTTLDRMMKIVVIVTALWTCGMSTHLSAQRHEPVMVCKGDSIKPLVRSYDGILYRVDVCAVTSSPEGDIFRYQVDEK